MTGSGSMRVKKTRQVETGRNKAPSAREACTEETEKLGCFMEDMKEESSK